MAGPRHQLPRGAWTTVHGLAEALASTSIAENMAGRPTVAAQLLEEADTIASVGLPDPLPAQVLQAKAVHAFFAAT